MSNVIVLEDWKDNHDELREWDDPCQGCRQYMSCVNDVPCELATAWASSFYGKFKDNHTLHNINGGDICQMS
jgi:hypothetical protein